MPRDTDRDLQLRSQARNVRDFADALTEWAARHNGERLKEELAPLREPGQFDLLQLRRRAADLYRSAQLPVAAAIYGPSQVGKSLFIGHVLQPADEAYSPLGVNDQGGEPAYYARLSFTADLNPASGIEATALVTRFRTKEGSTTNDLPEYPVLVRALRRADWLKVLARGCISVGAGGSRWDQPALEKLFDSQARAAGKEERGWRLDLFDAYDYLHRQEPLRFAASPTALYGLLVSRPLTEAGYVNLAARLFWETYPELTPLFQEVCRLLERIERTSQAHPDAPGILVPWKAVRFLLDSQRNERCDKGLFAGTRWSDCRLEARNGWEVLTHQDNRSGGEPPALALLQAALLEMVIPVLPDRLSDEWRRVLSRMDLLDLPGMRADQGGGAEGKLDNADSLEKRMQIVKRGKVAFLFDRYIDELQIQSLVLLARLGNLEVRGSMKSALEKWGRARYGDDWPRRVTGHPALFLGLTGIDFGFQGHDAPPPKLFDDFLRELMIHLEPAASNYGGEGKPFRNVFPIRYPGTMDQHTAGRQAMGAHKWVQAGNVFVESVEVRKHVQDAELRWQAATQDRDGGLSLIGAGLLEATDAVTKQNQLERNLADTRQRLWRLITPLAPGADTNVRRLARVELARKVLDQLTDNQTHVYYRVQVLFRALCVEINEVESLADLRRFVDGPLPTEDLKQKVRRALGEFLQGWASTAPQRWLDGERDWPLGGSWLEPDDVRDLVAALRDYLGSDEILSGLTEALAPIVDLRIKDEAAGREARRKYVLLLLNDYLTNPGPDQSPLEEPYSLNGKNFGLMQPFIERWCRRLPGCLAEGAGKLVRPPPGDDELKKLLETYR